MAPTMLSSSPMWMNRKKKKKKNVVFADSRGLALTAVHIFDEAEENLLTELQFQLTEIEGATAGLHLGDNTGEEHNQQKPFSSHVDQIFTDLLNRSFT